MQLDSHLITSKISIFPAHSQLLTKSEKINAVPMLVSLNVRRSQFCKAVLNGRKFTFSLQREGVSNRHQLIQA